MTEAVSRAVLGGGMLGARVWAALVSAQTSCDPSSSDVRIATACEVSDLDCAQVAYGGFTVYLPDSHGFDGDFDGVECERG